MIKNWINSRIKERTSMDGAVCIALGLMILFLSPLAKIAAGLAIAYGIWTIWKAEKWLSYFVQFQYTSQRSMVLQLDVSQ